MIRILGGTHRGRRLKTVPGRATRPSSSLVRKALFDLARPVAGGRVLDLFAGTGAVALEALSRGAAGAVAIEQAMPAIAVIRENARTLGLEDRLEVVHGDVLAELAQEDPPWARGGKLSLIFADPPYSFEDWDRLVSLALRFLEAGGILALEHAGAEALPGRAHRYGGSVISVVKPTGAG